MGVFERLQLTEQRIVVRVADRGAILDVVLVLVKPTSLRNAASRCRMALRSSFVITRPLAYASFYGVVGGMLDRRDMNLVAPIPLDRDSLRTINKTTLPQ